jgi:hypothetical protein
MSKALGTIQVTSHGLRFISLEFLKERRTVAQKTFEEV